MIIEILLMDIKDDSVIDLINKIILIDRLSKSQILHLTDLVAVSDNVADLIENFKWETFDIK